LDFQVTPSAKFLAKVLRAPANPRLVRLPQRLQKENQMTRFSIIKLRQLLRMACVLAALPFLLPAATNAQRKPAEEEGPIFREYRGVQIGMTAEETRKKLGNPKDKGDAQDFFEFGESEMAQIVYDATHKVVTVSVDFLKGAKEIPTPKAVVGADIQANADGSMHKMVRYEKVGVWVSYSRTGGDSPMVSVTLQKIQ
jgi:hypothetical protein